MIFVGVSQVPRVPRFRSPKFRRLVTPEQVMPFLAYSVKQKCENLKLIRPLISIQSVYDKKSQTRLLFNEKKIWGAFEIIQNPNDTVPSILPEFLTIFFFSVKNR